MHYLIDGYNLLFRLMDHRVGLKEQRSAIVSSLNDKTSLLGMNVSIIFDAVHQPNEESRSHFKNIEIYFTAYQQTADDFIVNWLETKDHLSDYTVVTSDRGLATRVKALGAKTETTTTFLDRLYKAYNNKLGKKKQPKQNKSLTLLPTVNKEEAPPIAGTDLYYLKEFEGRLSALMIEEEKKASETKKQKPKKRKPKQKKTFF